MPEQQRLYAQVNKHGHFMFSSVRQKKREVSIFESDKKYGGISVGVVYMRLLSDKSKPSAPPDDWGSIHAGWIIQNPDNTFWMDSLSQSEAETRAWWGDAERAAKREAIGFKVVGVQLTTEG